MRVSLGWLRELVDVEVEVEELGRRLSFSGTNVEAIDRPGTEIADVVVAEVLSIADHPNADNLTLVQVKVAEDEIREVVCGVRNFAVGDRVPLAQVGARVGELEIGERRIRGRVSQGMLCSPAELGVSRDHSGILVLPTDAPVGEDVPRLLGLDDFVLELEITHNRPDLLGMIGIAREVAALLGGQLRVPQADLDATQLAASRVAVQIDDPTGCPRYVARFIEGVKVAPAPLWMATRLLFSGIRPISNVVDVTNYVLLETGHPLHPFDAARVLDETIVVRRAGAGETLETLDGVERVLHPEDLVIADPEKPLAIAGVMGGSSSEVSDETTEVILESAYFDHASIAFSSRRHLLRTEASARFERGADPEMPPHAAARAAQLMVDLANGRVAEDHNDAYPMPRPRRVIELRPRRTNNVLGIEVSPDEQLSHLTSLGLGTSFADGVLRSEIPGFRPDLEREIDLIEEVARLAGLERLPSKLPPGAKGGLERDQASERSVRRLLAGLGMDEAWTSAFISPAELDGLGLRPDDRRRNLVELANPTSEDRPALRTTLLPALLRCAAHNVAHRAPGVALFEIARTFGPSTQRLPQEQLTLSAVFLEERRKQSWLAAVQSWDFFAVKGIVQALFEGLRLAPPVFVPISDMPFHPTRAARVSLGPEEVGVVGELHPEVCARFDVRDGALVFEFTLAPIFAALPSRPTVGELPRFPPVYIDVAVVVDESLPAGNVQERIWSAGAPEVTSVRLFDLYRGDQIPPGKKSLAFALELSSPDRTLTDEEAAAVRERIADDLADVFRASLRT